METQSNSFNKTLCEMRGGECLNELSEQLTELVGKVRETGKGGEITLKLKVKPASRGAINAIIVEDKIAVKSPELDRATSLFFATDENTLQRTDPNQKEIEFRTVQGGKVTSEELKKVS